MRLLKILFLSSISARPGICSVPLLTKLPRVARGTPWLLPLEVVVQAVTNTLFSSEWINPGSLARSRWEGLQQPQGTVTSGVELCLVPVHKNSNPCHGKQTVNCSEIFLGWWHRLAPQLCLNLLWFKPYSSTLECCSRDSSFFLQVDTLKQRKQPCPLSEFWMYIGRCVTRTHLPKTLISWKADQKLTGASPLFSQVSIFS